MDPGLTRIRGDMRRDRATKSRCLRVGERGSLGSSFRRGQAAQPVMRAASAATSITSAQPFIELLSISFILRRFAASCRAPNIFD